MRFTSSLWVKEGEFAIIPISSIEEATAYLGDWPTLERSALYYVAAGAVEAAGRGAISPDAARTALVDFCEDAGVLAEERLGS